MLDVRVVESSKIRVQIVWSEDIQTPVSAADDHPTYSKDFRSSDEEPVELALRQRILTSVYTAESHNKLRVYLWQLNTYLFELTTKCI